MERPVAKTASISLSPPQNVKNGNDTSKEKKKNKQKPTIVTITAEDEVCWDSTLNVPSSPSSPSSLPSSTDRRSSHNKKGSRKRVYQNWDFWEHWEQKQRKMIIDPIDSAIDLQYLPPCPKTGILHIRFIIDFNRTSIEQLRMLW